MPRKNGYTRAVYLAAPIIDHVGEPPIPAAERYHDHFNSSGSCDIGIHVACECNDHNCTAYFHLAFD